MVYDPSHNRKSIVEIKAFEALQAESRQQFLRDLEVILTSYNIQPLLRIKLLQSSCQLHDKYFQKHMIYINQLLEYKYKQKPNNN